MLCAKFGWYWPSGSREDFKILSMYFRYFLILISPWIKVWLFISTNFNPLYPRMLCAKIKLAQWFWRGRQKCKKFMTTITRTTKFLSVNLTWALSSGKLKRFIGQIAHLKNWLFQGKKFIHVIILSLREAIIIYIMCKYVYNCVYTYIYISFQMLDKMH